MKAVFPGESTTSQGPGLLFFEILVLKHLRNVSQWNLAYSLCLSDQEWNQHNLVKRFEALEADRSKLLNSCGPLFPQPLNRDNKTNLTERLWWLNEIKGVKGQSQHLVHGRSQMPLPSLFLEGRRDKWWPWAGSQQQGKLRSSTGGAVVKGASWQRPKCRYFTFTRQGLCSSQLLWLQALQPDSATLEECFAVCKALSNSQLIPWALIPALPLIRCVTLDKLLSQFLPL